MSDVGLTFATLCHIIEDRGLWHINKFQKHRGLLTDRAFKGSMSPKKYSKK